MKKVLSVLISCLLLVGLFSGCSTNKADRKNILKIGNWADYIGVDEDMGYDVITEFEEYYNKNRPESEHVEVEYVTMETNEDMLTKVEKGKEDFDLLCPSDYMIKQMIAKDLLKPIDTGKLNKYQDNLSSFIKDRHKEFEGSGDTVYSVSFMWGTMGILYNTDKVKDISRGWDVLWDSQYRGKVEMKDSIRDTFAIASIYANQDALRQKQENESYENTDLGITESMDYNETLTMIMNDTSDENLERVKDVLKEQKKTVKPRYEVDDGKNRLISGESWLCLAWSGDAIYAINEANANNAEHPNGEQVNLAYAVPEIGSNLWFDGWVIPKYAENEEAALAFIDFMLTPDIARKNMEVIGYTSGVSTVDIKSWLDDADPDEVAKETVNLNYFFGSTAVDNVSIPQYMYPDASIIENLAVMQDFGDRTEAVVKMWNAVRVNTLAIVLIVVLSVIAAAGLTVLIIFLVKRHKKNKKNTGNKTKTQGYRPDNASAK